MRLSTPTKRVGQRAHQPGAGERQDERAEEREDHEQQHHQQPGAAKRRAAPASPFAWGKDLAVRLQRELGVRGRGGGEVTEDSLIESEGRFAHDIAGRTGTVRGGLAVAAGPPTSSYCVW